MGYLTPPFTTGKRFSVAVGILQLLFLSRGHDDHVPGLVSLNAAAILHNARHNCLACLPGMIAG
jgi:metal-dependent hydrolase (beta-lactamase superfamily II)